jgi:catechol 2,3-dioxygenase-like lactoylglutathione lyase family enzyme
MRPSWPHGTEEASMTLRRMENVGVVVEDLEAAIAFFVELGMELEGQTIVDGQWAARVSGFDEVRLDVAMVRTPDGHSRLELMRFHTPAAVGAEPHAPANTLGIRRILFSVDDIDDVLARLRVHGAELVGGLEHVENSYRFCYVRGPEGIIVALAEQLG